MDKLCFLCNNLIENDIKISLETKETEYTNINLFQFLQNIAPNISLIEHCDKNICPLCLNLINDLDLAQKKCLDLTNLLLSYLAKTNVENIDNKDNIIELTETVTESNSAIKNDNEIFVKSEKCTVENVETNLIILNSSNQEILNINDSINKAKTIACIFCHKDFDSLNDLQLHLEKDHQNYKLEENTVSLQVKNLKEKSNVAEKKKLISNNKIIKSFEKFKCDKCDKTFKTSIELKGHINAHSDSRPYICDICGHSYKHKASLDIHIGMHNGINPYTCVFCNKSYTQKISLQRHMPIHTGECPYQCDLCGRRFIHLSSFKIHQASHSGKKDYKCEVCGTALMSRPHLMRHMRVHTGEKNFECPTCKKKFAERYNLMSHQKLHANEKGSSGKEHKCEICNLSFQRPNKLKKHKISKHQNVDFSNSSLHKFCIS